MGQTQDPQWAPPPSQPAGWGGGGMAPVERPMGVTLGSIYLIVLGVLMALGGAACGLLGGALFGGASGQDPSGLFGAIAGMAVVAGVIVLVLAVALVIIWIGLFIKKVPRSHEEVASDSHHMHFGQTVLVPETEVRSTPLGLQQGL